jgi:hypothetical protein
VTAKRAILIECDACDAKTVAHAETFFNARAVTRSHGWEHHEFPSPGRWAISQDFCPACVEAGAPQKRGERIAAGC